MRLRLFTLAACLGLACATMGGSAQAQSIEDKLRAQLRTVTEELNDLQNNQQTLQAQKAAAEQERDVLKSKLAAAGRAPRPSAGSAATSVELEQARAEIARLTQANKTAADELANYKDAYAKVVDSQQQVHGDRDRVAAAANATAQALAECETKNITLVKIGRDVLAAYTKVSVKDAIERGEPMIGLKRVKMERIAQDYGDKVYEAKFDPRMVKPAPAPTPAASATATKSTAAPPAVKPAPATP